MSLSPLIKPDASIQPESKLASKEWRKNGEPVVVKASHGSQLVKSWQLFCFYFILLSVWLVVHWFFTPTMVNEHIILLQGFERLQVGLSSKRHRLSARDVAFLQDNVTSLYGSNYSTKSQAIGSKNTWHLSLLSRPLTLQLSGLWSPQKSTRGSKVQRWCWSWNLYA